MNREQQKVLDHLREENRVLKEHLGTKKIRLTDIQRRRLAAKGWEIGRRLLGEYATNVTPDTLLRWHRKLIAQKRTNSAAGYPSIFALPEITFVDTILVRLAPEVHPNSGR